MPWWNILGDSFSLDREEQSHKLEILTHITIKLNASCIPASLHHIIDNPTRCVPQHAVSKQAPRMFILVT